MTEEARKRVEALRYVERTLIMNGGIAEENMAKGVARAIDLIESLSAQLDEKEKELEGALDCLIKLALILKGYPNAATNGCAYEAYKELQNYTMRGVEGEG